MYTNNPPAGAFRGCGVTQSAFAVESMMDKLAETLNIDPVELRRMNALHVGSITNTGQVLRESVGLMECIDKVDAEMRKHNPDPFKPIVESVSSLTSYPAPNGTGQGDERHWIRAWGFAAAYKNTGLGGGARSGGSAYQGDCRTCARRAW